MTRVACIGECMLELSGRDFQAMALSYGGDTLNTAVYLSRLGVNVEYVTALGDDPYSDWMIEQWRNEGVGVDLTLRAAGRTPGLYAIETDDAGERRFFYWRDQAPARDLFTLPGGGDICDQLKDFGFIYLSGITLSLYTPPHLSRLYDALDAARSAGCKIVFDTNYRPRGWVSPQAAQQTIMELLTRVDIATPTFDDDQQVFGDANAEACADRLHAAGVGEVVVKMDSKGCLISNNGGREIVSTIARDDAVDTTGAGDSFNAGYLAARIFGSPPAAAAKQAHLLAGNVIMHPGAIMPRAAMPNSAIPDALTSGDKS
jgi:2-dehydro-3-deoxygluconokinase